MNKFLTITLLSMLTLPSIAGVKVNDGKKYYNTSELRVAEGSAKRNAGGTAVILGGGFAGTKASSAKIKVIEDGIGRSRLVTIKLDDLAVGTFAGGANKANGVLLYTTQNGYRLVEATVANFSVKATVAGDAENGDYSLMKLDTPDCGFGTVRASGAVAVLGGTATFENLLTGQTMTNANGTALIASDVTDDLILTSSNPKTVYANCADGWATNGGTLTINGDLLLKYTQFTTTP